MTLLDRLEKRAKELDRQVMRGGTYNFRAADDRELFQRAARQLHMYEQLVATQPSLVLIKNGKKLWET